MNKKFLSAILFGALMVFSTGTFVSCSDYDDDIDRINSELADLKTQLTALQSQVNAGKYVTNVTKNGNGITVTWNDGTTSTIETIKGDKGDKGEAGAQGAKGDATVITIDPVTKNWLVDGVDTGVCSEGKNGVNGEDGKDAPKPIFTVGEDGHIYVQYGEDGEKEDLGASTGGIYYVDKGSYYELHICDAEGNWNDIKLPMTKTITDLEAVTITKTYDADGKELSAEIDKADVTLYFGYKVTDKKGLTFNGKTYAQNTYLVSSDSELSVIVNPLDADAAKYGFSLVDSKGNAPFKISDIKQNTSENALSRAASVNQGVWDMTLAFASTSKLAESGSYALTTETYNGTVASPYDVNIVVAQSNYAGLGDKSIFAEVEYGKSLNLGAIVEAWDVYSNIVDYYFEITDKTSATANGVSLVDQKVVSTTKNATFGFSKIAGKYLGVDGKEYDIIVYVHFKQVAPSTSLANVEWTINDKTADVYLSLSAIQAQLTGNSDSSIPTIDYVSTTWADGTAFDKGSVVVNGVNYGKADKNAAKNEVFDVDWVTSVDESTLYRYDATNKKYVKNDLKIQNELFAKFSFDYTTAFPGEYIVNVGFRKNGLTYGDYVFTVPVKVIIKAPVVNPFTRLAAYFNGDEATAYGNVVGSYVEYNMFDLFQNIDDKANVVFNEALHKVDGHKCAPWIDATATGDKAAGAIKVGVYNNAAKADNSDNVYSSRAIEAVYTIFGNKHIEQVVDAFNLTVKSEIYEGTLTAAAAASVSGTVKDEMTIDLKNITAKDVYGAAYYMVDTEVKNADGKTYTAMAKDARVDGVELVLADENAKLYLADPVFVPLDATNHVAPHFTVKSASDKTALQSDVTCKLTLKVTDVWGKIKTVDVTVTLKK